MWQMIVTPLAAGVGTFVVAEGIVVLLRYIWRR